MNLSFSDLCQTLSDRAKWTNDIIAKGWTKSLPVLEETITDVNLLEIAAKHDKHVLTKKFNRREEGARSGADWLWCIGEPGSWFCVLIQAKIVNSSTGTCRQLNYRGGIQCQLLKSYSKKHGFLPLYCIYNHIPNGYAPPLKARPSLSTVESFEWACSLLTPSKVQQLVRAKRTKHLDILSFALPLTHVFCQASRSGESRLGIAFAEAYAAASREVSDEILSPNEPYKVQDSMTDSSENARSLVKENLPRFILNLLSNGRNAPVAGISVISSIPIEEAFEGHKSILLLPPKPLDLLSLQDLRKVKRQKG